MKRIFATVACFILLGFVSAFGQQAPVKNGALPTFDLDFAGGSPANLVAAIEKSSGRPLNVIINKEDEDIQIPALKMTGVNVAQLFQALEPASSKIVAVITGHYGGPYSSPAYSQQMTGYSFKTVGEPTENSIWFFHDERPSLPPLIESQKVCRFYSLADQLSHGFTVDDITTAIESGWKMSGNPWPPQLKYHSETKLLIAYGDPNQLETIDQVLHALPSSNVTTDELVSIRDRIKDLAHEVEALKSAQEKLRPAADEKTGK